MYAQQYRQPPKDYGGTAIRSERPEEEKPEHTEHKDDLPPHRAPRLGQDELIIAVILFMVISGGGWEKNSMLIMALIFILL